MLRFRSDRRFTGNGKIPAWPPLRNHEKTALFSTICGEFPGILLLSLVQSSPKLIEVRMLGIRAERGGTFSACNVGKVMFEALKESLIHFLEGQLRKPVENF